MPDRSDAAARAAREDHLSRAAAQFAGVREIVRLGLIAIGVALALRSFAWEPYNIPSASMLPGLRVGDYLFVAKWPYGFSRYSLPLGLPLFDGRAFAADPARGDVVVFKSPRDNRTDFIKRVIGLPGDRVRMTGGVLQLNGRAIPKAHLPDDWRAAFTETLPEGRAYRVLDRVHGAPRDDTRVFTVPAGHYFVMGDNRDNSADSRLTIAEGGVGLVPAENLLGRADRIFFSTDRSARLADPGSWLASIRWDRIGLAL